MNYKITYKLIGESPKSVTINFEQYKKFLTEYNSVNPSETIWIPRLNNNIQKMNILSHCMIEEKAKALPQYTREAWNKVDWSNKENKDTWKKIVSGLLIFNGKSSAIFTKITIAGFFGICKGIFNLPRNSEFRKKIIAHGNITTSPKDIFEHIKHNNI